MNQKQYLETLLKQFRDKEILELSIEEYGTLLKYKTYMMYTTNKGIIFEEKYKLESIYGVIDK